MKLRYLISLTVLMAVPHAYAESTGAQTSPVFPDKIVDAQSYHANFRNQAYSNPSARFLKQNYSLTSLRFNAERETASDTKIAPLGKGGYFWGFNAGSQYILGDNNLVWGEASYSNGKTEDVVWNETSDFLLLYPYVMADEFGGDLQYEQYYLNGGWAGKINRWILGASLRYRAKSEYRTLDPRPNNTVADLKAEISAGYLFKKYSLALALKAGKYKQTNELRYFNDLGASKEYHLTGLGNEFVRFSGASDNVFYKGHNFGASLDLVPLGKKGISASVEFNSFSFDKILSDLNKLALNHLVENKIQGEFTWTGTRRTTGRYGFGLHAYYAKRNGDDNMFGDATGNVYPQIGSTRMYENSKYGAQICGFYEETVRGNMPLGISPFVAYDRWESSHMVSGNSFNTGSMTVGTNLQGAYILRRNMFRISAGASCRIATGTDINIPLENVCNPSLHSMLHHAAEYLDASETNTKITLHYQLKLPFKGLLFFVETSWNHRFRTGGNHDNLYTVKTGINL